MITVYENRYVSVKNIYGTQNENNVTELEIEVPQEYENWNKRIVFITDDGNKWDYIIGNIYKLKNNITKYQEVYCYIWLTQNSESEEESIDDFRSETFRLVFNKNIQADDKVPTEEQIDGFNTLINELNVALDKVNDISSDIERLKEEVTQTIEDLNNKVENGEFDGATFIPNVDAEGNISWTNDKGLPNPSTQNIKGEKGDQGKQGEQGIPGEKGEQGNPFQIKKTYPSKEAMDSDYDNMQYNDYVMIASNVDDEDNAKLYVKAEGETGWVFITDFSGAQGIQGQKGDKPVKGVDYFTEQDKQELVNEVTQDATSSFNQNVTAKTNEFNTNATTKTNEFNSNASTKTNDFNENASAKTEEFNQNTEVFENRLTSLEQNDLKQDELITKLKNNQFNLVEEGTSINVQDSSDLPAVLEVSGGERQATREGTNILDLNVQQNEKVTVNEDGTITINGTGGFSLNFKEITLMPGTTYYQKYELVSGQISNSSQVFMALDGTKWLNTTSFTANTVSEETNKSSAWVHANAVFENAVIKIWANTDQSDFEQYGASPSPDYRSEVETVGDNINLFDKDNANILNSYIGDSTKQITSSANNRSLYIECLSNTTYTISKILSGIFRIGTTNELPKIGSIVNNYQRNDIGTALTINTDESSKYIVVDFANNTDIANSKVEEILNSIKIEPGKVATSYSPYGMGSVEITKINANITNTSNINKTISEVTFTSNNDGSLNVSGTGSSVTYRNIF